VVDLPEPAARRVLDDDRPGPLGLADDHRVRVFARLVGQQRRVGAAEDDQTPAPAKGVGQRIDVVGVGRIAGDADQVGGGVEIDALVVLIDYRDPVGRSNEAGEVGHRQLDEVVELTAAERFDEAILGSDEQDAHGGQPLSSLSKISS